MKKSKWRDIIEMGVFFGVCILLNTQVFGVARIPSGSMEPTINIGDVAAINKLATKYEDPSRGDVVVFLRERKLPHNEYWIKRVVGLPNETVDIKDGHVYIDGVVLEEEYTVGDTMLGSDSITFPYTVPENHYFLMGDNREYSKDSRVIGAINRNDITAIGAFKVYPIDDIGVIE